MFKKIFLVILFLNVGIFLISVNYKIINFLHHKNNNYININDKSMMKNHTLNNKISSYSTISALTLVSQDNYDLIKEKINQWENEVKIYNDQNKYLVVAFDNMNINKLIKKLNYLGFKTKIIYDNVSLGLFDNEEDAKKLKQKAILNNIDVGIMKINNNDLNNENKYIIYFKDIDYFDFYEIMKILNPFSILIPIFYN